MRQVKSAEEIALLQRAVDVTGAGIEAAARDTRPGMHEYEVQAVLEAEYRRLGSPRNGFPSIVASGANSCTLHYTSNRRLIEDGDLLLLDTGAEVAYYGADVTRTVPANGAFTPEQRAVYDVVHAANLAGIERCTPGATVDDVHRAASEIVVQGLIDLEILSGEVDALIEEGAHRPYFMHSTSHWLGLDVHDVGVYKTGDAPTELADGMVLTVEPGIYLAPDAEGVPEPLRGIGIRIEDDVLVTSDGHRNLSEGIPSEAEALEGIVGAG
jgi:Xaa-Pro aminopeptidase